MELSVVSRIRKAVDSRVATLTGRDRSTIDYSQPVGDPGLFGPGSAVWLVHSDFVSMLCGGIGALLLQMLHPLALAGVWDHSTFRQDMMGRLRRTSQFIAMTSYGNRHDAQNAIEHVKNIHSRVTGTAPDGRAYRADAPELLRWVHIAEMSSFLTSYIRYCDPDLSRNLQDQYFAESSRIAEALGATEVPTSCSEVEAYMASMHDQLHCDERTQEVARLLLDAGPTDMMSRTAGRIFMRAGIDLLPEWAKQELGLSLSPFKRKLVNSSIRTLSPFVHRSVTNTACQLAHKRMGVKPPRS